MPTAVAEEDSESSSKDNTYHLETQDDKTPRLLNQRQLSVLVRDLSPSEENAEVLGSRLQQ